MVPCIVWIILGRVIFRDKAVCCEIKEQASILSKHFLSDLIQSILSNNLAYYDECADVLAATTPRSEFRLLRKLGLGKESEEVGIGVHSFIITFRALTYSRVFGLGVLLIRKILPTIHIVHILCIIDGLCRNPIRIGWNLYKILLVHSIPP